MSYCYFTMRMRAHGPVSSPSRNHSLWEIREKFLPFRQKAAGPQETRISQERLDFCYCRLEYTLEIGKRVRRAEGKRSGADAQNMQHIAHILAELGYLGHIISKYCCILLINIDLSNQISILNFVKGTKH